MVTILFLLMIAAVAWFVFREELAAAVVKYNAERATIPVAVDPDLDLALKLAEAEVAQADAEGRTK